MRIRARYSVGPDLRFLGNFDMMHVMERALRRAGIAYALSEGFNPHIKLSMGTVLPVGIWGKGEFFDLELETGTVEDFVLRINQVLPEGMHVDECREIMDQTPSLMKAVNAAAYTFAINQSLPAVENKVKEILSSSELPVQSRGKKKDKVKDVRPGIFSIRTVLQENALVEITMLVSVNEPLNVRFDELLELLDRFGIDRAEVLDFYRETNYIKKDNKFYSPLEKVS
ncbi:MAG: TIGR03936 family radical SAM-associated protein [Bacillota bacterium]|nr:TIGR03936 family radical SAM-associated protein [Bacillota bacterium]